MRMTNCKKCGSEMVWHSDESSEHDIYINSFYSCSSCETLAHVHRYTKDYCLEIIRSTIDPDSELYNDIKHYMS